MNRYYCPVCWARVRRSNGGNITGHFDTVTRPCPASGYPFSIALITPLNGAGLRHTIKRIQELREAIAA
ncbi:Uncharacterised protein [Mycobacteroides abscessus subsp. bolletii]|nr:Uncharacterised protein [Mycobacteroides abscessus subsp. bolletii]SKP87684.1 Uncharacterised protein [Mycobacteroides abscessus subsp. bolletii]SKQ37785.1 Uncharacterised protein [Mycobacteroides abscessus subsp. bolletii]SKQ52862.1 Uncharacterised protein [Mycobacteroides abscessus subsp. bolletii]SLC82549.1 Uncharacterised protein [Mycobacteroides abscessus subsp. massiliense]